MVYNLFSLFFGWLISLYVYGASCIIPPTGVGPTQPFRGISFDISLKVSLLYQTIDLLLELVVIFHVGSFNFMKLTPSSSPRSQTTPFWSWRHRDIMQVKNLPLDLLTMRAFTDVKLSTTFPLHSNIALSLLGEV